MKPFYWLDRQSPAVVIVVILATMAFASIVASGGRRLASQADISQPAQAPIVIYATAHVQDTVVNDDTNVLHGEQGAGTTIILPTLAPSPQPAPAVGQQNAPAPRQETQPTIAPPTPAPPAPAPPAAPENGGGGSGKMPAANIGQLQTFSGSTAEKWCAAAAAGGVVKCK